MIATFILAMLIAEQPSTRPQNASEARSEAQPSEAPAGGLAPPITGKDWLKVTAHVVARDGGGIGVGEPFRLVIEAEHAPGSLALLPEDLPFDQKLAERKSARKHARVGDNDKEIDRYELELLAFEAGEVTVPKIPLALGSTRAESAEIPLEVSTGFTDKELPIATSTRVEAIAELEKMAAEDPSARAVMVDDPRLLYLGAALLLAAIAFLVARRLMKARQSERSVAPPPPPPRPAHVVALERLEALRKSSHLEARAFKPFLAELSEIIREYLGARYAFDSLDLTVDELMLELGRKRTPGLDAKRLKSELDAADLVKFAKFTPELAEATGALAFAFELVDRTKPAETPPSAERAA
jgi:hypothetical protein